MVAGKIPPVLGRTKIKVPTEESPGMLKSTILSTATDGSTDLASNININGESKGEHRIIESFGSVPNNSHKSGATTISSIQDNIVDPEPIKTHSPYLFWSTKRKEQKVNLKNKTTAGPKFNAKHDNNDGVTKNKSSVLGEKP